MSTAGDEWSEALNGLKELAVLLLDGGKERDPPKEVRDALTRGMASCAARMEAYQNERESPTAPPSLIVPHKQT